MKFKEYLSESNNYVGRYFYYLPLFSTTKRDPIEMVKSVKKAIKDVGKVKISPIEDFSNSQFSFSISADTVVPLHHLINVMINELNVLAGPLHTELEMIEYTASNLNLTTTDKLPPKIDAALNLKENKLTSLHNIHMHIKEINGNLLVSDNNITECVLGVLLIKNLTHIYMDNKPLQVIINKYLPNTRGRQGVMDCQTELMAANFSEFAKL